MPRFSEDKKTAWPLIVVGILTLLGLALRLHQYGSSLLGDELSTLWIVKNPDSNLFDLVSGDAEITPPLYFLLAKLSTGFGSAPELVRLPALVAGTACIPMIWLLGKRTVGQMAGLIAAALMTLSPFMIFFSGNGRGYTLMLALLIGSTLAMLAGSRTGRVRWWVVYGALSCLAVYTHYTALFFLLAQFIWLLWSERESWRPALIANIGAALLFLPCCLRS
ncbi:MAG: glycosyltransferase family 39 protein [Solirubrobacterales bacterium]|nr:glycosyltransferase family 39 protein [Solirubrobacterales bacterium]